MNFKEKSAVYIERIQSALKGYMACSNAPKGLREAMEYSLMAGGKRLRPSMVLASCEMLGEDASRALPFACALEMIHTYSLIHDDLPCMDDDDFRRGRPSNHKVFGEANAVLAGDGLLSYAFDIMLEAIENDLSPRTIAAARAISAGAGVSGMVAGQYVDLYWEGREGKSEEELRFIHSHKTADMLTAAMLAGGSIAGADAAQLEALRRYGESYGLLFQITDDILDIEGSFEGMGKSIGKDSASGKLTYALLYGIDEAKVFASRCAQSAKEAISVFGEGAEYFKELADATLDRRS